MGNFQINIGLLHGLEQCTLYAGTGYIGTDQIATGGDFVNFIDVDNAVLRKFNIVVRFSNQIPHKILDIAADITGFAEFGGIPFDKRHADFVGNQLNDIGFAHTGRTDHEHIVFDATDHGTNAMGAFLQALDTIEMGADLGGQNGLGIILFDHILVQVGNQFLWL